MDFDDRPRWLRWTITIGEVLFILAIFLIPFFLMARGLIRDMLLWQYMAMEPEPDCCALCEEAGPARPWPRLLELHNGILSAHMTDDGGPAYISPGLYCRDCRAKLGAVIETVEIYETGYVLVDLYDPGNIRVYPVSDGAIYDIRGYTVELEETKDTWTVTVTGEIE